MEYRYDELYHYGVKGMRWGVRKMKPVSSSSKSSKKNTTRIGWDDDVLIKKGSKVYRISGNQKDSGNHRYVTIDQNDRNFYKGMWPSTLKGQAGVYGKDANIYEQKYKTTDKLISPSAAKRQKMASDLAKTEEVKFEIFYAHEANRLYRLNRNKLKDWDLATSKAFINESLAGKDHGSKGYAEYFKDGLKQYSKELDSLDEPARAARMLGALGNSDRLKTIYGKAIVEAGYNMVIDDHGADFAGNKQRVNAPIIVLKADEALKQIGSKKISDFDERNSMMRYQKDMRTISGDKAEKNFVPNVLKTYYGTKNYYDNPTFNYVYDKNNVRVY